MLSRPFPTSTLKCSTKVGTHCSGLFWAVLLGGCWERPFGQQRATFLGWRTETCGSCSIRIRAALGPLRKIEQPQVREGRESHHPRPLPLPLLGWRLKGSKPCCLLPLCGISSLFLCPSQLSSNVISSLFDSRGFCVLHVCSAPFTSLALGWVLVGAESLKLTTARAL